MVYGVTIASMRRAQIQIDERTYQELRHRAFRAGCSVSRLVREILQSALFPRKKSGPASLDQFTFVGIGKTRQGRLSPVSRRHDAALAEAISRKRDQS